MERELVFHRLRAEMEVRIFLARIFLITLFLSTFSLCNGEISARNFTDDTSNNHTKCCSQHSTIFNLGAVVFWGAQTYLSTNIAHVVLCIVVVVIYICMPRLGRGLYNRAVVRHNICLMMHGLILQMLGVCELMDCQMNEYLIIFAWLCLQYFTIATVFWLNVISFDMTVAITQFRWVARNINGNNPDENRKLLTYGLFAWGGSMLPTLMAGLCDYIPGVSENFPLKPNYLKYRDGRNIVVNMYFFTVPTFTLLLNNILFVFTTYRIVKIQRSTEIATHNQTNILKQKYFLFLRLYLFMGAPWFFGMLLACFNKLVVLKICRLVQPSLWLLMILAQKRVIQRIKQTFKKYNSRRCNVSTITS